MWYFQGLWQDASENILFPSTLLSPSLHLISPFLFHFLSQANKQAFKNANIDI